MVPIPALPPAAASSRARWIVPLLVGAVIAAWAGILLWRAASAMGTVFTIVAISWFLSLVLEPPVGWFVRRGARRSTATGVVGLVSLIGVVAVAWVFGDLFVEQLVALVEGIPGVLAGLREAAQDGLGVVLPESDVLVSGVVQRWGDEVALAVVSIGDSIIGALVMASSVLLVTYYMTAAGPRMRVAICRTLTPRRQAQVLQLWGIAQTKVSNFISSRIALAALCTVFTGVFLTLVGVPYALPLALFTGVVSQFVPTIGTYIGGAVPIAVALVESVGMGVAVLVFVVCYQQVENLVFSPRIARSTMELDPAVSFLAVISFGAVFGALGAFLALPVAATIQAVATTYGRRHDLIDSAMLTETPVRRDADAPPGQASPSDGPPAPTGRSWRRLIPRRRARSAAAPAPSPETS
ncbi:AI-2E family transporter [Cellulomonas sp. S1-8]|uniref:AI-2E family transporter n=1 Tax=Cellulomonas sp. S1-8 TaxID=2904790 RepID=UPI002244C20C|nr:AI-2E family transporter [Cellulomonas sp. S1-8]UZN03670.1 AI-2E family transporter [Cellulomonas sp. S1-8]